MSPARWLLLLSIALSLSLSSCSRDQASLNESTADSPNPLKTEDRTVSATYTVRIEGELDIDFSETIELRVFTLTGSDPEHEGLYLLSVGPKDRVPIGQGVYFRVAFDLLNFKGNGTYRIRAGSPRDLVQQVSPRPGDAPAELDQSNVLIQYWPSDDLRSLRIFDVALEPCLLEVLDDGLVGTLSCSGVAEEGGPVLRGIVMRWAPADN